jgi:L-iditol 2-dehydrogenase
LKAAYLRKPGQVDVRIVADPLLSGHYNVLLRVDYVGLCGSDYHYFRTGRIGDQNIKTPFIIGHECTATVLETGNGVRAFGKTDRVAVEPAVPCGQCDQCLAARPHTCRRLVFMGCPEQLNGALCEYLVMPAANCYPVPDALDSRTGVLIEPLSIALYAWRFLRTEQIRDVVILGCGPIGLCILQTGLKLYNIRPFVFDPITQRKALAISFGAEETDVPSHAAGAAVSAECDAVFECCGQPDAMNQAIDMLRPGGHLVVVGIPESDVLTFDPHLLRRKEITIHHVRRQNGCMEEAINFCVLHQKELNRLITHQFPIDEVQSAFELAANYRNGAVKVLVKV